MQIGKRITNLTDPLGSLLLLVVDPVYRVYAVSLLPQRNPSPDIALAWNAKVVCHTGQIRMDKICQDNRLTGELFLCFLEMSLDFLLKPQGRERFKSQAR